MNNYEIYALTVAVGLVLSAIAVWKTAQDGQDITLTALIVITLWAFTPFFNIGLIGFSAYTIIEYIDTIIVIKGKK